ncbi:ribosome-associated protein [Acidipropionibacterium jensenii]|uniref:Ribosome-associated protein n=2 Tax=Acidipropionibacterium jensenii TaxID=1749 RepID=A0A448NXN8_9ACTN|nr:ribosome-associated protein [Acidipropionibacterium jensenii]
MVRDDMIRLGQFLKFANLAETGGRARELIAEGLVYVNGEQETRRGRQLHPGDDVAVRSGDQEVHQTVELGEIDVPW